MHEHTTHTHTPSVTALGSPLGNQLCLRCKVSTVGPVKAQRVRYAHVWYRGEDEVCVCVWCVCVLAKLVNSSLIFSLLIPGSGLFIYFHSNSLFWLYTILQIDADKEHIKRYLPSSVSADDSFRNCF